MLSLTVLPHQLTVPSMLAMAPPSPVPLVPPTSRLAEFCESVLSVIVTEPRLRMAPPMPAQIVVDARAIADGGASTAGSRVGLERVIRKGRAARVNEKGATLPWAASPAVEAAAAESVVNQEGGVRDG